MSDEKSIYPKPKIGYYQAECCLLDLYKIETKEDLDIAIARFEDNDEYGQLMVFPTLREAFEALCGEFDSATEREQMARLGWFDT